MTSDVVSAYQKALANRDFDEAGRLLSDDLRFDGPFESFNNATDYLTALRGLWGIVESVEQRHMSSNADQVVVLYDMATRTPAGTQLVCEWYGVSGGKISWIRALFDSAPFAFLRQGT